jgi:putative hydrolase of the HAD superfamily
MSELPDFARASGLVFDAVGTLIEATPSVAIAYTEVARRQGLEVDPSGVKALFRHHFGVDEVDEIRGPLATDEEREQSRWRRIVSNVLPDLPEPERGFGELWEHFGRAAAWRCFDDVGPALEALDDAGLPFCIASNFDSRLRRVVAGLSPLAPWAERLVISSEVGYRKPHPAFYQAACDRLGLPKASVLWVGDDLENDVFGPSRAGCPAVMLDREGRARPGIASLPDLTGLVARLIR